MSWFGDNWHSLVGLGTGLVGSIGGLVEGQQNLSMQKENLAYQKDLQNKIFEREDTAIQRRIKDLEAAGLSPTLINGGTSGAGAGATVQTTAPQGDSFSRALAGLQLSRMATDIAKTQAETGLIEAQTDTEGTKQALNISTEELNHARVTLAQADVNLKSFQSLDLAMSTKLKESDIEKNGVYMEHLRQDTKLLASKLNLTDAQAEQILKNMAFVDQQIKNQPVYRDLMRAQTENAEAQTYLAGARTGNLLRLESTNKLLMEAQIAHLQVSDKLMTQDEALRFVQTKFLEEQSNYFTSTGTMPNSGGAITNFSGHLGYLTGKFFN